MSHTKYHGLSFLYLFLSSRHIFTTLVILVLLKLYVSFISQGRLQKLDRAGLLGTSLSNDAIASSIETGEETTEDEGLTSAGNPRGGVVLSRAVGIDPAVIQALRALVSSDEEFEEAGFSVGNFAAEVNPENERKARIAARTAIEMELASKSTTLEMDREMLKRVTSSKTGLQEPEELMAIMFRIEKKKLLKETIDKLQ